jgi:hypothetical protein
MSEVRAPPRAHYENISDIADYAELECFRRDDGSVSLLDIARIVQRASDADVSFSDDAISEFVRDAFGDIENRALHCGEPDGRFPFSLNTTGTLLTRCPMPAASAGTGIPPVVYLFLLLVTQLNMRDKRMQGGHDGALIFEEMCSHIATNYWGGPHSSVNQLVFGTARFADRTDDETTIDRNTFKSAIADLCAKLQEGLDFDPKDPGPIRAKDAKLDVVVWRKFSDRREGQLIGFGQCKTGTHWEGELTKLQPEAFCDTWLRRRPAVVPTRMFFVSARVLSRWYERSKFAGILFDRCRIVEYAMGLPSDLLHRISAWVEAAMQSQGLTLA